MHLSRSQHDDQDPVKVHRGMPAGAEWRLDLKMPISALTYIGSHTLHGGRGGLLPPAFPVTPGDGPVMSVRCDIRPEDGLFVSSAATLGNISAYILVPSNPISILMWGFWGADGPGHI